MYFSLGGLTSDVEDFAGVDELIGAFLNTWYMIDPEDPALKEYQDMIGADLPGDEADMNPEQIFAILEALSDTQIFSNVEYDKDEKIEGVDCSKMTFDGIDAEALWTVLMEMQRVFGADEITEADKAEFLEALEMIDLAGAIWIGKTDKYMCKMEANFTVTEDGNVARVNLAVVLANINQAVNVNAPADAQNFLEAIEQMFAGMMGGFDDMDYDDYDWDDDFDWDDDYEWPDYDDMTEEEWLEFMNQ
ncbi:MAG TPA: hypothetical protein ENN77_00170 [Candidatus Wirthbacteria bacterium]|nr:hypothetical protein [Candidatus Wirthbacteria bacterium]